MRPIQEAQIAEFGDYRVFNVPNNARFYVESSGNDIVKNYVRAGYEWESELRELINAFAKKGTIALDVGAHIGIHSVSMSRAVGEDGAVYSFEPQPKIYKELRINMAINDCKNVYALNLAVGNEKGQIGLGEPLPGNQGGRYISRQFPIEFVDIARIDDFELENVSFIKMDVEGFEEDTLKGAEETINKSKPVMYIEIHSAASDTRPQCEKPDRDAAAARIKQWIVDHGYNLLTYPSNNYLAVPI